MKVRQRHEWHEWAERVLVTLGERHVMPPKLSLLPRHDEMPSAYLWRVSGSRAVQAFEGGSSPESFAGELFPPN